MKEEITLREHLSRIAKLRWAKVSKKDRSEAMKKVSILGVKARKALREVKQEIKVPKEPKPKETQWKHNNCYVCGTTLKKEDQTKYCLTCIADGKVLTTGLDHIREQIRKRDNWTCQMCGKVWISGTRRLDVHHTIPEQEGRGGRGQYKIDRENMDKMITLCHKCHLGLPHIRKRYKKGQKALFYNEKKAQ